MFRILKSALLLVAAAVLGSCCQAPKEERRPVEAVVLIGSDGLSADIVRRHPGAFPHIESLFARGMSTLEARSVLPSSSAINWATLLMGAGSEMHGFTDWGSQTPEVEPIVVNRYGLFPGIFGQVRLQRPEAVTGVLYSWGGIGYLYEQQAVTHNFHSGDDDRLLADEACRFIGTERPALTFVCFAEPDGAGHTYGWESEEYLAMCRTIDSLVGRVVECADRTFDADRLAILFTADHGGIGKGHGGKTMSEMQVPYVVVAPGIEPGSRFPYEVMRYDNAPTIADLMGIDAPDAWRGKSALR